jgi:maltose alpha-D-glucosyltransferase/alpha-amylase
MPQCRALAALWYACVVGIPRPIWNASARGDFVPQSESECEALLHVLLMEKCVYEFGYELNNRPDWVHIPVRGMVDLVEGA